MRDNVHSLSVSAWAGAYLGVGLQVKTNTKTFRTFSYSIQPLAGIEYVYGGLFYGYNFNIDGYRTQQLNTHTVTLRLHLAFITKMGHQILRF
ncbi:MAG TPA: hypothetical protein VGC65_09055 [Bacteroidia bacterium]|jgi:hypothetical protein